MEEVEREREGLEGERKGGKKGERRKGGVCEIEERRGDSEEREMGAGRWEMENDRDRKREGK